MQLLYLCCISNTATYLRAVSTRCALYKSAKCGNTGSKKHQVHLASNISIEAYVRYPGIDKCSIIHSRRHQCDPRIPAPFLRSSVQWKITDSCFTVFVCVGYIKSGKRKTERLGKWHSQSYLKLPSASSSD